MKLIVLLSVTLAFVFVDVCFGNENGHLVYNYYGLHNQRAVVPAEENKIAVYKIQFPYSVS